MRQPRLRTALIGAGAALALAAGGTAAYAVPASGSVGSRPTPSMLKAIHQPVINKRLLAPAAKAPGGIPLFNSGNWAGYLALPGGSTTSFKQVVADYTVPSANCNGGGVGTGDAFAYHWIGLDGWSTGTVEQDGVADFCVGGTASYYAWWEMYPNGINLAFQVSPGDAISSRVTYNGSGNYTLYLLDDTSGQSFNMTEHCPTTCSNKSAEDITEGYQSSPWLGTLDYAKEYYNAFQAINQSGTTGGIASKAWSDGEVQAIGATSGQVTSKPGALYSSYGTATKSRSAFEMNWFRVN